VDSTRMPSVPSAWSELWTTVGGSGMACEPILSTLCGAQRVAQRFTRSYTRSTSASAMGPTTLGLILFIT
jgi:hypothetical protein